jgi:hypothetical protein
MSDTIDLTNFNFVELKTLDLVHLVTNRKGNHTVIKQAWQVLKTRNLGQNYYHIVRDCKVSEVAIEAYHLLQQTEHPTTIDCYKVATEECAIIIFKLKIANHDNNTLAYIIDTIIQSPFVELAVLALHSYIDYDIEFSRKVDRLIDFCTSRVITKIDSRIVNLAYNTLVEHTKTDFEFTLNQLVAIITKGLFEDIQVHACKTLLKQEGENYTPYFFVLKNCHLEKIQKMIWAKIKKSSKKIIYTNFQNFQNVVANSDYKCSDKILVDSWEYIKAYLSKNNQVITETLSETSIVYILKKCPDIICDEVWELSKSSFNNLESYLSDFMHNCNSITVRNDAKLMFVNIDGVSSKDICNLLIKGKDNQFELVKESIKILKQKGRKIEDLQALFIDLISFGDFNQKECKFLWKKYLKIIKPNNHNFVCIVRNCKHYDVVIEAWLNSDNHHWKTNEASILDTLKHVQCEEFAKYLIEDVLIIDQLDRQQFQSIAENQFDSINDFGWSKLKECYGYCFDYVHTLSTQACSSKLRNRALEELSNEYYTQYQKLYSLE